MSDGETNGTAPADQWVAWDVRDGGPLDTENLARLARYVAPDALAHLNLVEGVPAVPQRGGAIDIGFEERVVADLFERLAERRIVFGYDPWDPRGAQIIRHPGRLLNDGVGTCIDFATTFAAMCLARSLSPLLVIGGAPGAPLHALVVVVPGADLHGRDLLALLGTTVWGHGCLEVTGFPSFLEELKARGALAIDFSFANADDQRSFADVVTASTSVIEMLADDDGQVWLVDIPWQQSVRGETPYVAPSPDGINGYLPIGRVDFKDLSDERRELREWLAEASGVVVLYGEPGMGKSTLALQIARDAPFGAGWFLNGSDPKAFVNSLRAAEGAGRYRVDRTDSELLEREGDAFTALSRLNQARGSWVVVVDNADGKPSDLARYLPKRNPDSQSRQLVIITTTNPDWEHQPECDAFKRLLASDADLPASLQGQGLDDLADGRPLLFDAFARFISATGSPSALLSANAAVADGIVPGAAQLWAAVRTEIDEDSALLTLAARSAYFPPDHQPLDVLASGEAQRDGLRRLQSLGMLNLDEDEGLAWMHRRIGEAVRAALPPQVAHSVVREITFVRASATLLIDHADLATTQLLADTLTAIDDGGRADASAALGVSMHGVAKALELHGHSKPSARVYELADRHFEVDDARRAAGFHGRARLVNQQYENQGEADREAYLQGGLVMARQAQAILRAAGMDERTGRSRALEGLLMQKLAAYPKPGETTLGLRQEALSVIEEAHQQRLDRLGPDSLDPELARSEFNLGGIRLKLAQDQPDAAQEHLDIADSVYEAVRRRREVIYGLEEHPHIAACWAGLGYVAYFRAILVEGTPAERDAWLRDATDHTLKALHMRQRQDGATDGVEVRKLLRFWHKVVIARSGLASLVGPASPDSFPTSVTKQFDKAVEEIVGGWEFLGLRSPAAGDVSR